MGPSASACRLSGPGLPCSPAPQQLMPRGGGHRPLTTDHWEAAQNRPLPGYFAKSRLPPLVQTALSLSTPQTRAPPFSRIHVSSSTALGPINHKARLAALCACFGARVASSPPVHLKCEAWRPPHQPQLAQVMPILLPSCPILPGPSCHPIHPTASPRGRREVALRLLPPPR